jgi:hypothetical protein
MEKVNKSYFQRRDFLRHAAVLSLGICSSTLFLKAYNSEEDCIGDGKCKKCLSNKKCDLELAKEYRSKITRHKHG